MRRGIVGIVLFALLLAACGEQETKPPQPPAQIPAAKSALFGSFLWQEDGGYAYAMLRPAGWSAVENISRVYLPPGITDPADWSLLALNFNVFEQNGMGDLYIEPLELFQKHPTLEGWTRALELTWEETGVIANIERVETLESAVVYAIHSDGGYLRLTAYAVDQGEPLLVILDTRGTRANLDHLREEGVLEDFLTVVGSIRAYPYLPGVEKPGFD